MGKNIVRLNRTELENVISKTVTEAIRKEKNLIKEEQSNLNENFMQDIIINYGELALEHAPAFFFKVLQLNNGWQDVQMSDLKTAEDLYKAKELVGSNLAVPTLVGAFFATGSIGFKIANKIKSIMSKKKGQ